MVASTVEPEEDEALTTEERLQAVEKRQEWQDWRTQQVQDAMLPIQSSLLKLSLDVGDLKQEMAGVKQELSQHRRILLAMARKMEVDMDGLT